MSVALYQQLQVSAETDLQQPLAFLTPATLQVNSQQLDSEGVKNAVNAFNATSAWVMYRDEVAQDKALERCDVIEGEWVNGSDTLKVKLLGHEQYLVVTMTLLEQDSDNQVMKTQQIKTRFGNAKYALWYQLEAGRWQALTQQFLGFVSKENA